MSSIALSSILRFALSARYCLRYQALAIASPFIQVSRRPRARAKSGFKSRNAETGGQATGSGSGLGWRRGQTSCGRAQYLQDAAGDNFVLCGAR